jgi:cob(I)alamin adenosyltransferase
VLTKIHDKWEEAKVNPFKFSKKGDAGETSLLTGERVSKSSLRPETYGTLDEASSALGIAKAATHNETIRQMITTVQQDLVILGAELACEGPEPGYSVDADLTRRLEEWIERLQEEVAMPRHFVLPGDTLASAVIDLARTMVRRAERRAVAMRENGLLEHPEVHVYLNRLADFLFTLARYAAERG